ncbi:DUF433 domain-containing protein [Mucilaginibacter sp. RS28]|uniref:DUF433 domain-containing protein n=1 Tax=Mucilaginibacter straminoryzae TaxID=2932774 RepID=A0A9X1X2D3_9SPHI|nr:DUF433 domain-containing protein [Mucilaginibacter straminoryzae]MCJ8209361.1 DUF433 domain-containing protein [Mucilaginibacter straminoryzae]
MDYAAYIEIKPEKRFGKPCVIGTRISVYDVLSWLSEGMTVAEIIDDFPELNEMQIKACLAYAADREHKLNTDSLNEASARPKHFL